MRKLVVLLLGIAFASGAVVAGSVATMQGTYITYEPGAYGPFTCNNSCQLQMPAPDGPTLAYIQSMDWSYKQNLAGYERVVGDKFIVCNANWCVSYFRTSSMDQFWGGNAIPVTTPGGDPNVGGGGEGGGASNPGGGGGYSGPIGGGYGGGGTVDVGPVIPIQNP
ncbi:hypothetical protein [Lysobacter sp. CA196]|uniref:hypothetical protein n=1 Tax=Lysobacter sp. CA196 TaxID=3455606 RepID=UPI003F8D144C